MEKIRIGVLGAGRGEMMMKYCEHADNAELVAVCDQNELFLNRVRDRLNDPRVRFYTDFGQFLAHDMDAVVLANYATEHAPFAIRCLEAGKHVLSEVLPCQTLSEAVALAEAVEKSGRVYAYSENYCFMPAPREMRRLYRAGKLGEFEYGEGEYLHNCEPIWPEITQGRPEHWRNNIPATFYCTHSVGPLLHITGLRPVRVTGFELPYNARCARMGAKAGLAAVEMVELENGALLKSVHGLGIARDSIWYTVYGSLGRMESAREDAELKDVARIYCNLDSREGENAKTVTSYEPADALSAASAEYGHGGSDYYTMWNFAEKLRGNPEAVTIDVYEALDMGFVGLFAYRSILAGGVPVGIPDFRHPLARERYRFDAACTDPTRAGAQYVPSCSKGNPEVPQSTYDRIAALWQASLKSEKQPG
jgi:predicted dehydrogenase